MRFSTKKMLRLPAAALMVVAIMNIGSLKEGLQEQKDELVGRFLQTAFNGIDYYELVGDGQCVDVNNQPYDIQHFALVSTETHCAQLCSSRLLMTEHLGFQFDGAADSCKCLWENDEIPERFIKKGSKFPAKGVVDTSGEGSGLISGTDGSAGQCYKKKSEMLPTLENTYEDVDCDADLEVDIDIACWEGVSSVSECAEKCMRFKLHLTHLGFEYDPNTQSCDCQFIEGEAPSHFALPKSSLRVGTKKKSDLRTDRRQKFKTETNVDAGDLEITCKKVQGWEQPDLTKRVDPTSLTSLNKRFWINEIHYRNAGIDTPFIEVIGPAGESPAGYKVILYQARNGRQFKNSFDLEELTENGTIEDNAVDGWAFLTVTLVGNEIRKGKMGGDGVALVYGTGEAAECLQFFSYTDTGIDHSFSALAGACANKVSTPMGVLEPASTPEYHSLQLTGGPGSEYNDFTWAQPANHTMGKINNGQVLTPYSTIVN